MGSKLVTWVDTLNSLQILANNLYYIIGTTLVIALILTIFLMVGKYVKIFSKTSGIFQTIGLERRKVYTLLLLQLLIICMISLPFALILTSVGYKVINYVLMLLRKVDMSISFDKLIELFGVGVMTVFATALIFFVYAILSIRKQTVKQLLSTEIR